MANRNTGARPFGRLYDLVQRARNEALHQGVFARNLADQLLELSLVLEDALANGSDRISDYMVRTPIVAYLWQPLRVVRHQMLSNSFSFLPVATGAGWQVVSDLAVARVLRKASNDDDRALRLAAPIEKAIADFGLELQNPQVVQAEASIGEVLARQQGSMPVLVTTEVGDLIGIATPFDFL